MRRIPIHLSLFAALIACEPAERATLPSSQYSVPAAVAAQLGRVHPYALAQSETYPEVAHAFVEIPRGDVRKWEVDTETGRLEVSRLIKTGVSYPAAYGFFPRTLASDGDPLDVLVLTDVPLAGGTVLAVRPVAILRMIDKGELDQKVLAVPAEERRLATVRDLSDVAPATRQQIEHFFTVYKTPPGVVQLQGFGNAVEARRMLEAALAAYAGDVEAG